MRLLLANWHRGIVGGAERYLQSLIPELLTRGHDVAVLHGVDAPPDQPTIDPADAQLPAWCVGRLGVQGALRAIDEWKPSVIYAHGSELPELDEALVARYPAVMFAHGYYGTCETGSKCHSFPRPRPCARTLGPMCLVLHYPRRCGGLNPRTMLSNFGAQSRRRAVLPRYRAVLVASRHMEREFGRHGVASDRLHLVPLPPPGMAPDKVAPIARASSGTIMMAGRLTTLKGGGHLIRAAPRAARALGCALRLSVAGAGPDRAALEEQAREHGVAADFHGWVSADRLIALMRQADLLAVPSVWPEPFGLVGIEAGCVGLPAVAYQLGGIADWLMPGTSGELAPGDPPTVDGLAEAIVRALRDPARHAALRRGAWETARRFTMDAHMRLLEPLLVRAESDRGPVRRQVL